VRSVHELLKSEFGLEDGLASTITWAEMLEQKPTLELPPLTEEPDCKESISPDEPFVQILDPATGTATFLVEVIDIIYKHLADKWQNEGFSAGKQQDAWNDYVPQHLLPRLHGYELMMAPYAIAHMKIGLKLKETGYRFEAEERARIYLTNALEPWVREPELPDFDALAHEAAAVNEIKQHKRFTVVVGNPPYSVSSQNKSAYIDGLLATYKKAVKSERNIQPLSDDYIKFIRLSQKISDTTGIGMMGLITNNSYLSGLIHRGVREELLKCFNRAFVLDLHGNSVLAERADDGELDENVFDIRPGVSIILLSKNSGPDAPETLHSDIIGEKNKKYSELMSTNAGLTKWQKLMPVSPDFFFVPKCQDLKEEYERGWKLNEIFPVNISGIKTHRDGFVLDFERSKLEERIGEFRDTSVDDDYFREAYGLKERAGGWCIRSARSAVQQDEDWKSRFQKCLYRPFDVRYLFYARDLIDRPRDAVMDHMVQMKDNIALLAMRQVATGDEYSHFGVTKWIVDNRTFFSNRGIVNLFPLYLRDTSIQGGRPKPNFSS
jgi:predicted helicase